MRAVDVALAIAALITGLIAAWHWYKASRILVDPGWTQPGEPGPSEPAAPHQQQRGWTSATIDAFHEAAALNKTASFWTAGSVAFGAASAIVGALAG
jgi:hypothetical protein